MTSSPSDEQITIVIADDHAVMREGLASLLDDEPDMRVVGQADNGLQAVALVRQHRPQLALLDITMPDMNGLEAARRILEEVPQTRVLMLTMHQEEAFFFEALRSGAAGYVLKGAPSDELLRAVRAVSRGGVYLPPELAPGIVQYYLDRQPKPPGEDPLTPRESEVLVLIAQGLSNGDIAERLNLTVNTVKTHRRHIYEKLDLHDRADLVAYALRHGLLQE